MIVIHVLQVFIVPRLGELALDFGFTLADGTQHQGLITACGFLVGADTNLTVSVSLSQGT